MNHSPRRLITSAQRRRGRPCRRHSRLDYFTSAPGIIIISWWGPG